MTLSPGFEETMHELAAPDAHRLRIDWDLGSSGARLTLRDCEQLHEKMIAKRVNIGSLLEELRGRTQRRIAEWDQRQADKKAVQKANRDAAQRATRR